MTVGWKRWIILGLLCLPPFPGYAITPLIAGGGTSTSVLTSEGTVLTWGLDDSGVLGTGRALSQTTLAQVTGLNIGTGIEQAMVSAQDQTLIVDAHGQVWAWGDNSRGQLGDGSTLGRTSPARIQGLTGVRAVSAGLSDSVFLKSDGTVWSTNSAGGIEQVSGLTGMTAIATGYSHAVALKSDGTVWTWGANQFGQLGNATIGSGFPAAQVSGVSGAIAVAASGNTTFALASNGTVFGWGDNTLGQLADGGTSPSSTPLQISGLPPAAGIASSLGTVYALLTDGTVWGWGSIQSTPTPSPRSDLTGIVRIAAGPSGSLFALKTDGTLWGTGNSSGELGIGTTRFQSSPVQVPDVVNPLAFALGQNNSVVVKSDGSIWLAGSNSVGQLGTGASLYQPIPAAVVGMTDVVALASGGGSTTGDYCTIAVRSDGTLWGWGGRYCLNIGQSSSSPVLLPGVSGAVAVSVGASHTMVLKSDGTVWTWGTNFNGELGNGAITSNVSIAAAPVPGLAGITAVAAGDYYSLALGQDGTLWAWGINEHGQLGDGTATGRASPVSVGSGYVAFAAGTYHSAAIKADGTLWTWGRNTNGQLGDGTSAERLSPVPVGSGFNTVAVGVSHTVAIKTDGTLWAWGANSLGQVGDGSSADRLSPLQIGSGFSAVAVGRNFLAGPLGGDTSVALRTDGTVWAWGGNSFAKIGDGTFATRSAPVLAVNEGADGPLDLLPAVVNDIPGNAIPPFLVVAHRAGDLSSTTLEADIKGISSGGFAAASDDGRFAALYDLYVAASIPSGASSVYYQLDSNSVWGVLHWPMAEFLRGVVLDSQNNVVSAQILQNVDLSALAGAEILVGYGTDPDEMVASGRYRQIFTVPFK